MILALLTCLTSFGQATKRERNLIKQGNEYFNKKQYSKAEESYSRVLEINPNSQIAKYNLGSTMLRQRGGNSEKDVARDSLISRYLSDGHDYANSGNYFKPSLKIHPNDDQARKNLRMAQKKLQQNQQNQDKNKNKDKDDQKKKQDKQQPPQNQPQPPKERQQQTNNDQLLKAMQNEEKNTRDKVNRRKAQMNQSRQSSRPW